MTGRHAAALVTLAVLGPHLQAQSSWCQFRPGTLGGIISTFRSDVIDTLRPGQRHVVVSASTRAIRAVVTYLGDSRALLPMDSTFLDDYLFRLHRIASDSAFRALFHRELRFVEGNDTLWLPVQDGLISGLQQEARLGDRVTLFVRWLGLHQEGREVSWVFVVNEFWTQASDSSWRDYFTTQCGS